MVMHETRIPVDKKVPKTKKVSPMNPSSSSSLFSKQHLLHSFPFSNGSPHPINYSYAVHALLRTLSNV